MIFRPRIFAIFTFVWLLAYGYAMAVSYETGPRHVGSAWNINKGGLVLSSQARFYSKREIYTGANQLETGVTIWDSQVSASLFWGLANHWQLGFIPILSQKNHVAPGESDVPGDLLFNAKLGSLGSLKSPLKLALQFDLRVPTGAHHNIPLQPYAANSLGYGAMGMLSINTRPSQPTRGLAWDMNLGYFNHNDLGLNLTNSENDTMTVESATTELLVGSLARLMGKRFGLFVEFHGRVFLQQPPSTAFTRENSVYITPGLIFQFNPYIQLIASADFLKAGKENKTQYESLDKKLLEKSLETMPDWRFNFGLSFRLREGTPLGTKPKPEKAVVVEKKTEKQEESGTNEERNLRELEDQLKQQKPNETVETEEERQLRIQVERERMKDILKRLRDAMDEEEKAESSAGEKHE